jgi:hypothetical protein
VSAQDVGTTQYFQKAKSILETEVSNIELLVSQHDETHDTLLRKQARHAENIHNLVSVVNSAEDALAGVDVLTIDDTGENDEIDIQERIKAKTKQIFDLRVANEGMRVHRNGALAEVKCASLEEAVSKRNQLVVDVAFHATIPAPSLSIPEIQKCLSIFEGYRPYLQTETPCKKRGWNCTYQNAEELLSRIIAHFNGIDSSLLDLQRNLLRIKTIPMEHLKISTSLLDAAISGEGLQTVFKREWDSVASFVSAELSRLKSLKSKENFCALSTDAGKLTELFSELKWNNTTNLCVNFTKANQNEVQTFLANTLAGKYQNAIQNDLNISCCQDIEASMQLLTDQITLDLELLEDLLVTFENMEYLPMKRYLGVCETKKNLEQMELAIDVCTNDELNVTQLKTYQAELMRMVNKAKRNLSVERMVKVTDDEVVKTHNSQGSNLQAQFARCKHRLALATKAAAEYSVCCEALGDVRRRLEIAQEYKRLVGKAGIPFRIVDSRMEEFKHRVNLVFGKYAPYHFDLCIDHGKQGSTVRFDITHKPTGVSMEPSRLCGFEAVVLRMAVNFAALALSRKSQCTFLLIDEALDCLHERNFLEELPRIIEVLKPFYPTMLLISHREIPNAVVDQSLRIRVNATNTASFINN